MDFIREPRSTSTFISTVALALVVGAAADVRAQDEPRWDATAVTGLFLGHPPPISASEFDNWSQTGQAGFAAGRYLTKHVKAEGEVLLTGEGRRYVQQFVQIPGVGSYPVGSEHMVKTHAVSGALAWQFFENQWVHPFVFAGASLDFDRTRVHTWPQSYYRGDPRLPGSEIPVSVERTDDLGTTRRVRGIFGVGAKLYVVPRAFFRTDTRIGIGGERSGHVAFRLGFGVDF